MTKAIRFHDISCGHRVYGHESKCAHLHGHNYRITFELTGKKDSIGRILDFSFIKARLCQWLEENWDHKMLLWHKDPLATEIQQYDPEGITTVPFNPTAENMAEYLVNVIGPQQLVDLSEEITLTKCIVEETRKCSASYEIAG